MPDTTIQPYLEAAAQAAAKALMPTKLGTKGIAQLSTAVRVRSTFSAKVESARVLDAIRLSLENILTLKKQDSGKGWDRDEMMKAIRSAAESEGIVPTGPGIQDITSVPRLRLIADMNSEMATGYADWVDGQGDLESFPAQRFERVEFRVHPREDWPERWKQAAQDVEWEGVNKGDDMIALKTSPIWERLSVFGTPWEPFDWGSGMGITDVSREDAVSLGLIAEDEKIEPIQNDFNAGLSASAKGMSPDLLARLVSSFEGDAELVGDEIRFTGEE